MLAGRLVGIIDGSEGVVRSFFNVDLSSFAGRRRCNVKSYRTSQPVLETRVSGRLKGVSDEYNLNQLLAVTFTGKYGFCNYCLLPLRPRS